MKITVLGSGTSTGVPIIGCPCKVCQSPYFKNKRTRTSAWIQIKNTHLLIDTSTDFRFQALRAHIPAIDAVLYTHPHADHVSGIDELRCYNFIQKKPIPVFAHAWTLEELKQRYPYLFKKTKVEGGGIPQLRFYRILRKQPSFMFKKIRIIPLWTRHGSKWVLGFRIQNFAYVTDCHFLPAQTLNKMHRLQVLILDCARKTPHPTHLHLQQALSIIQHLKPKKAYLTHLSHDFDALKIKKKLPSTVQLAYDGLEIVL